MSVCEINEDENKQGERRMALQEGKLPGNLNLKKDRDLEMQVVTPEGRGTVLLEVCKAESLCVTETWWDNPWVLGQTGRTWLPAQLCHLPVLRPCQRFISSPTLSGRPSSPFLLPPDFVAEEEPRN